MSDTVAQSLLRQHEVYEGASLPHRVGGRILTLPTLAWLCKLYDQELRRRLVSITAMAHSENLTETTAEITDYIREAVGRIKAAEAWAGVIDEIFLRLQIWLFLGLGAVAALLAPLWHLSGAPMRDLAVGLALALAGWVAAALISVPLLGVSGVGVALWSVTLFGISAATTWSANVSLVHPWWLAAVLIIGAALFGWSQKDNGPEWRTDVRGLLAATVIVAVPFLAVHAWFRPHHAVGGLLGAAGLSLASYLLVGLILPIYCVELYRSRKRPRAAVILGLMAVGGAAIVLGVLLRHPGWASVGVRSGLWTTLTLLTLILALVLLSSTLTISLWRWKSARNPADDVVDTLLAAALTLEFGPEWDPTREAPGSRLVQGDETGVQVAAIVKVEAGKEPESSQPASPTIKSSEGSGEEDSDELLREAAERFAAYGWRDPDLRRDMASRLNFVALLLERDLPQRLRTGSYVTDQYLGEHGRRMAAAVQGWARTLLLCGPDGLSRCRDHVRRNLMIAAAGEWEAFARADPTAVTPQVSLPRRLLGGLGVLLTAVLPGAIVGGLYLMDVKTSVVVPPALLGSAATFSVVWFLAQVLGWLNPHSGASAELAGKMLSGTDTAGKLAEVRGAVERIRPT